MEKNYFFITYSERFIIFYNIICSKNILTVLGFEIQNMCLTKNIHTMGNESILTLIFAILNKSIQNIHVKETLKQWRIYSKREISRLYYQNLKMIYQFM